LALASVMELDTVPNGDGAGVIQAMHVVVNPDKLGHLGPVSDVARLPGEGSQR
jgi:RNA polymerase sigma-70 factor (ECF subfamily)